MENRKDYGYFLSRFSADAVVVFGSWMLAYFLRFEVIPGGRGTPVFFFLKLDVLITAVTLFFINRNGLYHSMRNYTWIQEVQRVGYSAAESVVATAFIFYFFFPERISRLSIGLYGIIVLIGLVTERVLIAHYVARLRARGKNVKRVLLVGFGEHLQEYYSHIRNNGKLGLRVLAQIDGDQGKIEDVQQSDQSLEEALDFFRPDVIAVSYPLSYQNRAQDQLNVCSETLAEVLFIPSLQLSTLGNSISDYYSLPVVHLNHVKFSNFDRMAKRALDLFGSVFGLVVLSPVFLLIAVIIKISSRGPVLFKQERVTIDERTFKMLKFRTMKHAPSSNRLEWTKKNDPRITAIGGFLRKTSLDELPQLWNVLRGEMSLVGPRPERMEFVQQFNKEIPGYRLRHKMNSGMSGWAQINGLRGDTSIEKRIDSDLYYIRNWSIGFDIKIILLTFIKGFVNKNAY
ncbi:MAG: undecaprenyl-phosphate glucose phosphotransferase [Spirochaetota bacterium]